jgi:hypothetical protein
MAERKATEERHHAKIATIITACAYRKPNPSGH